MLNWIILNLNFKCEASYVGLKEEVPAYLDPSLSLDDLITGVCFASAGSGFDPLTAEINVIN